MQCWIHWACKAKAICCSVGFDVSWDDDSKNFHKLYTKVQNTTQETRDHHESSISTPNCREVQVQFILEYIGTKWSLFSIDESPILQNITTKVVVTDEIRNDVLSAVAMGKNKYMSLQHERFVLKTVRLSSSISRRNLKTWSLLKTEHINQQRKQFKR